MFRKVQDNDPARTLTREAPPSRRQRRALDRRADRLLERIRGEVLAVANDVTSATAVILATEAAPPVILRRETIGLVFLAMGMHPATAHDALGDLGDDDPELWPVIIVLDDFIQSTRMRVHSLVRGGAA